MVGHAFDLSVSTAVLLFVMAAAFSVLQVKAEPLRLHPENPHYFLFRGRSAVLVTSGEHYGAVLSAGTRTGILRIRRNIRGAARRRCGRSCGF